MGAAHNALLGFFTSRDSQLGVVSGTEAPDSFNDIPTGQKVSFQYVKGGGALVNCPTYGVYSLLVDIPNIDNGVWNVSQYIGSWTTTIEKQGDIFKIENVIPVQNSEVNQDVLVVSHSITGETMLLGVQFPN